MDEGHAYRGAFGCHTALVLRRLRRVVARAHGAQPLFIMTSATVANPRAHAAALLGLAGAEAAALEVVIEDGSPSGPRLFGLWNPPLTAEAKVCFRGVWRARCAACTLPHTSRAWCLQTSAFSNAIHAPFLSASAVCPAGWRCGQHAHRGARCGALHLPRAAAADAPGAAGGQRRAPVSWAPSLLGACGSGTLGGCRG